MIIFTVRITTISIEVRRVGSARSYSERCLILGLFLTLLLVTDYDCILVLEMTASSAVVLSSPCAIKTQDHPI